MLTRLLALAVLLLAASASAHDPAYDRSQWPHWTTEKCQSTRTRVLIRASSERAQHRDPNDRCSPLAWGYWTDYYTGEVHHDPWKVDVDHLVSLAEAHRSGGAAWNRARRRAYANYTGFKAHLVVTGAATNRAKGDRGPLGWLPPGAPAQCQYVQDYAVVKFIFGLQASAAERAKVQAVIEEACP